MQFSPSIGINMDIQVDEIETINGALEDFDNST